MTGIQTAEIHSSVLSTSGALKEGKFVAVWALEGIKKAGLQRVSENDLNGI